MLSKIQVHNIKVHENYKVEFSKKLSLIFGNNGIGKTSILESISLFTIGKGIFNLDKSDIARKGTLNCKIILEIDSKNLHYTYDNITKIRNFYFKNTQIQTNSLLDHIKIFGISPYISLAFWKDLEIRRKIINRIIMQYDNKYSIYFKEYTNTLKKRNYLIKNNTFNNNWREILDPIIQKNGLFINSIRREIIENKINKNTNDIKNFLRDELRIDLIPNFEEQEKILKNPLDLNFSGPHLTKFLLKTSKNINTSTGQEKKLLLALLIMTASKNENSILLLDDVFNNLDENNINELIDLLDKQNFQTIITHTNEIINPKIDNIKII